MNHMFQQDWNPKSDAVLRDQRAAYDEMRERCPVAYSDFLGWSLFRHEDIVRVLNDPDTFSNAVSRHLSVPNGMDPPSTPSTAALSNPIFGGNAWRRSSRNVARSPRTLFNRCWSVTR